MAAQIEYAAVRIDQTPAEYRQSWLAHVRQLMARDAGRRTKAERERLKKQIRILCMM